MGKIYIVDRRTRSLVHSLYAGKPRRLAFTEDGAKAVVADEMLGALLIN